MDESPDPNDAWHPYAEESAFTSPDVVHPPIVGTMVFVLAASLFMAHGVSRERARPGGPFLSIKSDVAPTVGCLLIFFLGVPRLQRETFAGRLSMIILIFVAVHLLAFVLSDVCVFWMRNYPRGSLFGF